MPEDAKLIDTLEELRRFVADTLGKLESLKSDHFDLAQRILYRAGKPCGIDFWLHGPRALCLSAIWEMEGEAPRRLAAFSLGLHAMDSPPSL